MRSDYIAHSEWKEVNRLTDRAGMARARIGRVLELIKEHAASPNLENVGLAVHLTGQDPVVAEVLTPVGAGRIKLEWRGVGLELAGQLVLEKKQLDSLDRTFWEPVWALAVPERSLPYVFDDGKPAKLDFDATAANNVSDVCYIAAMCIAHRMAWGPIR